MTTTITPRECVLCLYVLACTLPGPWIPIPRYGLRPPRLSIIALSGATVVTLIFARHPNPLNSLPWYITDGPQPVAVAPVTNPAMARSPVPLLDGLLSAHRAKHPKIVSRSPCPALPAPPGNGV